MAREIFVLEKENLFLFFCTVLYCMLKGVGYRYPYAYKEEESGDFSFFSRCGNPILRTIKLSK